MRVRKSAGRLLSFSALLSALALAGLYSANASAADFLYPGGRQLQFDSSYVNDTWNNSSGVWMPLTDSKDINNSKAKGYVLPNQKGGRYAASGGGAVGWEALEISKSVAMSATSNETDNQARKQAIYDFLYKKNTATSGADLDWERMGSSLIVHQLLEGKPPKTGRGEKAKVIPANDPMWGELKARLVDNDDVTVWLNDNYKIFVANGEKSSDADGNTIYLSDIVNTAGVKQNGAWASPTKFDAVHVTYGNYDSSTEMTYVWEFKKKSTGEVLYALVLDCANPIGGMPGLPTNPIKYSLTPAVTSPADGGTIKRGASTTGSGSVTKTGDNAGSKSWYITRLMYGAGVSVPKDAADSTSNPADLCADFGKTNGTDCIPQTNSHTFDDATPATGTSSSYKVPDDATPESQICYVVSVKDPTQTTGSPVWRHSAKNCITVAPPSFILVPDVIIDRGDGSVVEAGTATEITSRVQNTGADDSEATIWRLTRLGFKPDKILSDAEKVGRSNSSNPCDTFVSTPTASDRTLCTTAQVLSTDQVFPKTSTTTFPDRFPFTVPDDAEVGTKVCFVVSVSPPTYDGDPDEWRHSAMRCVIVGKKPKMQVWGGDVRAGGRINTSTSTIPSLNSTFGSWSEYGALSRDTNVGFASGAGLAKGNSSATQRSWSSLTFANVTGGRPADAACTFRFGCFTHLPLVSMSLINQFDFVGKPDVTSTNVNDLNGIFNATNVNLVGTTVQPNLDGSPKYVVINATGTVTISGDITYSDALPDGSRYSSPRQIPQVIINASRINIQGNVTNVDAWLFAGSLNTCSKDGSDVIDPGNPDLGITANQCKDVLRVNGPVVADKVYLMRTAGSEESKGGRGGPGEVFNLRADAYLWGYGYGSRESRIQTVHIRELAPRF